MQAAKRAVLRISKRGFRGVCRVLSMRITVWGCEVRDARRRAGEVNEQMRREREAATATTVGLVN